MLFEAVVCAEVATLFPPALRRGDTIAIIAPASPPIGDGQPQVQQCIEALTQRGFKVRIATNVKDRYGYLAGHDEARAAEFMSCWLDPEVKALWCFRGGYGCNRILSHLDFEAIKANPKILVGMSDITLLHVAIHQHTGLVTFLGPNANFVLKAEQSDPYSEKLLWDLILNPTVRHDDYAVPYPSRQHYDNARTLRSGTAIGKLTGGNLSVLAAMVGTPWQVRTEGAILVLEDVKEEPYRIDRMLFQLKAAGLLDNVAGVILSSWHDCCAEEPTRSFTIDEVLEQYFGNAPYPVLMGFPSGHIDHQATLPIGAVVKLDASQKTLSLQKWPLDSTISH